MTEIAKPVVPGGPTDSTGKQKTAEELAAEEAARLKAEEEAKAAEEAKKKQEEEEAARAAAKAAEEGNQVEKIILTTDEGEVEYELDKDGNAVKDGEIVYTKEQLDEFAKEEPKDITVADISAISGITPLNSDGTPKEYDMTVEGLAKRDADIIEIAKRQGSDEAINNFFKLNPDIYQAALYKQTYGSLDGFANHIDWTTMKLEGKSAAQMEAIIRSAEKRKGSSDTQIERIIKFSKADQVLEDVAKESLEFLANTQAAEIKAAKEQADAAEAAAEAELDKAYGIRYDEHGKAEVLNIENSIYDKVVNKGTIGGLNIPTAGIKRTVNGKEEILSRKDLVRYLTEPVIEMNGSFYTQAQKDVLTMLANNDMFAAVAIKNFLGADVRQLAEATLRTEAVRRLNITSKGKTKSVVSKASSSVKVNPNRRPNVPGGIVDSN